MYIYILLYLLYQMTIELIFEKLFMYMGWLWLVGSIKL